MARKRKPCEWCEHENIIRILENCKQVDATVEIYPENGVIGVCIQYIDEDGALAAEDGLDIPLNYCPNCGRKLGY